jgi:hypothetical protein
MEAVNAVESWAVELCEVISCGIAGFHLFKNRSSPSFYGVADSPFSQSYILRLFFYREAEPNAH